MRRDTDAHSSSASSLPGGDARNTAQKKASDEENHH
jgi:hypothetical protein